MLTTSQPMGFVAKPGLIGKNGALETMRTIRFGAVDAGHLRIHKRLMPWELVPQNRGEHRGNALEVFSMTWKSVSISVDQRSAPETVDRENGLWKSSEVHLVAPQKTACGRRTRLSQE
jgi:hypothetical protein